MREWITIIEQMYIPCRTSEKERQAHIDRIEKHTQEIEWEEVRGDEIPPEARRAPEHWTEASQGTRRALAEDSCCVCV